MSRWRDSSLITFHSSLSLPRPPILIASPILLHRRSERPIEVNAERVRETDGNENYVAKFVGDIVRLLAALQLLEAGVVTQRASQLADLLGETSKHLQRREINLLDRKSVV